MKYGITNTAYSVYGREKGYATMKKHGYDHADFQGMINTEREFFTQPLEIDANL